MVNVIMMAIDNSSQEGGVSKQKGKVKVFKPKQYVGEWNVQKLKNFLFDMDQYFLASSIELKESRLNSTTMILINGAKVW